MLQDMDPFVFEQMQPYVAEAVFRFGGGRNITEADINRMAAEVVRDSRFHLYPPIGYNQLALLEIARFLLLISLYNTYGYNLNPFWQLYFGGIPGFVIPFLVVGHPLFRNIPWRRPFRRPRHGRPPGRPGHGRPPGRPPHGGGHARPPGRPPHGGGQVRPPAGRPPQGGGQMRPPAGRPPQGGGQMRPPQRMSAPRRR